MFSCFHQDLFFSPNVSLNGCPHFLLIAGSGSAGCSGNGAVIRLEYWNRCVVAVLRAIFRLFTVARADGDPGSLLAAAFSEVGSLDLQRQRGLAAVVFQDSLEQRLIRIRFGDRAPHASHTHFDASSDLQ